MISAYQHISSASAIYQSIHPIGKSPPPRTSATLSYHDINRTTITLIIPSSLSYRRIHATPENQTPGKHPLKRPSISSGTYPHSAVSTDCCPSSLSGLDTVVFGKLSFLIVYSAGRYGWLNRLSHCGFDRVPRISVCFIATSPDPFLVLDKSRIDLLIMVLYLLS
ncbi:hypothetical protein ASPWEDRAFT_472171 [Aspergillus wentii DTO 134E9]|uniref:Uncharacterized protein n=1 Tax=Aspergillus wentii DTO 134E9 TaxID=1073089 RepID=A0A1L9RSL9_ASPWE|nr:uncharacterized protein ASPWEDRAFT_472171 [Aspergillus wentii DTO 134E9]OJJ37922.1 hypothetical protein ASPWEDRAFT_472171 [Aspergillus wentii DTO 134E9]